MHGPGAAQWPPDRCPAALQERKHHKHHKHHAEEIVGKDAGGKGSGDGDGRGEPAPASASALGAAPEQGAPPAQAAAEAVVMERGEPLRAEGGCDAGAAVGQPDGAAAARSSARDGGAGAEMFRRALNGPAAGGSGAGRIKRASGGLKSAVERQE